MTDNLEQIFLPTERTTTTPEQIAPDKLVVQAIAEFIGDNETDEEVIDFGNGIIEASSHPSFPRALFDQSLIEQKYREEDLHLDKPFLAGLYTSQYMESEHEELWTALTTQRQTAIDVKDGDQYVPRSITESRMIGYLVGRKLATGNPSHLPKGFDKKDPKLVVLKTLADNVYPAFRPEFRKEPVSSFADIKLVPERR